MIIEIQCSVVVYDSDRDKSIGRLTTIAGRSEEEVLEKLKAQFKKCRGVWILQEQLIRKRKLYMNQVPKEKKWKLPPKK